jgi:hypothetical protein
MAESSQMIVFVLILLVVVVGLYFCFKKDKKACKACKESFTTKYTKNNGNVQYREGFYDEFTSNVPVKLGLMNEQPPTKKDGFYGRLIDEPSEWVGIF